MAAIEKADSQIVFFGGDIGLDTRVNGCPIPLDFRKGVILFFLCPPSEPLANSTYAPTAVSGLDLGLKDGHSR